MNYILIDGKQTSLEIKNEIKNEVSQIIQNGYRVPKLVTIIVGNEGGSTTYVKNKNIACDYCGIKNPVINLDEKITEDYLLNTIKNLNNDNTVDGIIVQLPLPTHINENVIINAISPDKDIDGFHPINIGNLVIGLNGFIPATPLGIYTLLQRYKIETSGKKVVIVGRSNIVGKPLANLMLQKLFGDATVTVVHSHSKNIADECRQADILIAAVGKPNYITNNMVKCGATVIDVGTTLVKDDSKKSGFKLTGDVDFNNVAEKCYAITPVPGGVGPMTVCMLMQNTLKAYKLHIYGE